MPGGLAATRPGPLSPTSPNQLPAKDTVRHLEAVPGVEHQTLKGSHALAHSKGIHHWGPLLQVKRAICQGASQTLPGYVPVKDVMMKAHHSSWPLTCQQFRSLYNMQTCDMWVIQHHTKQTKLGFCSPKLGAGPPASLVSNRPPK